jgi:5-methylcytosine-specific restriction endonuclease McrA
MKTCTKCKQEKDESDFYKHVGGKNGLCSVCKSCEKACSIARAKTEKGKAERKAYLQTAHAKELAKKRRQSEKGREWWRKWKVSESGKESIKSRALRYYNSHREECVERSLAYQATEEGKAAIKAWNESDIGKEIRRLALHNYRKTPKGKANKARADHKRRATERIIISTLTAEEWAEIKKRYKYRCVYCGGKCKLEMDHIIPISKGGNHVKENIVPACHSCNSRKSARPVLLQLLVTQPPPTRECICVAM